MKLVNATYLDEKLNFVHGDIFIENGLISTKSTDENVLDCTDYLVLPGLIDIHTHGIGGFNVSRGEIAEISNELLKHGVTSFLATTVSDDALKIKSVLNADYQVEGSNFLGFHLEGPYINPKCRGAHIAKHIKTLESYDLNDSEKIKIITLAPEIEGAIDFIKNTDIIVSMGHSDANYETATLAIEAGAKSVTHSFNAMSGLHHREPGIMGAVFDKGIFAEVICDGIHVHPSVIRLCYKMLGEKMILISDSMAAAGLPAGVYSLGDDSITVESGVARTETGALAGSTINVWQAVLNARNFGVPFEKAVAMASRNPAKLLNLNKGEIKIGKDADLILVKDDCVKKVILNGELKNF